MELTERREGKVRVVAPVGRINMESAKPLEERLIPLVESAAQGGESVVLDFSGVEYISSAGLRVLMMAAKKSKESGVKIAVAAMQPVVNEIFEISRFTKVLACHASVDEAIAAVSSAS